MADETLTLGREKGMHHAVFGETRSGRDPGRVRDDATPGTAKFSCATGLPLSVRVLQIATVGENPDAVFVGIRTFPAAKLILLHTPEFAAAAREVARRTAGIKLPTELRPIEGDPLIACLQTVSATVRNDGPSYDEVIINTGAGPRMMTCSLLAAAFVNGVRAIDVMGDRAIALPVLKFSYTELVTEAKLRILKVLEHLGGEAGSLEELTKKSGLDKSLLSYHIRGGRESRGLESLGLVEVDRGIQGRLALRLTPAGRMMLLAQPELLPTPPR
jgi:DNA-binding transcriptional ArsR family regulator